MSDESGSLEETREQLREAIRGAFYSQAEEDKGLQTHMAASFVEFHMVADHDVLTLVQQLEIIGVVHTTILKMLHANPSSLQMAHAHAYIHALADTYSPDEEDEDGEESDTLLEEAAPDLAEWSEELAQYMEEMKKEDADGEGDPSEPDPGSDQGGTTSD